VLLSKIEVIAVGSYGSGETTTTPRDEAGEQTGGETVLVTVAASTVEAAKIIYAASADAIYLTLLTDTSEARPGQGVDSGTVLD
jgi:hypothetical protein